MKTVMLRVSGDNDYSANTFESSNITVSEMIAVCKKNGGRSTQEIDGDDIDFQIKEFDLIPEDFIKYVKDNIIDYDMGKHENYYFENITE